MLFSLTCFQQLWYSASKAAKWKGWGSPPPAPSLFFGAQISKRDLLDLGPGLSLRGDSGGRARPQGHPGSL